MNEPLHPSTLSEILDRTAQLYRARFLLFLGISILPTGVMTALACIVALVVAWWSAAGARAVSSGIGFAFVGIFCIAATLVAMPIFLATKALATAAMNHAASRVHMGETTTIRDAYKTVWRRGWRYIWLCFLQILFVWVIPIAAWIALLILVGATAGVMKAAGMGSITGGVFFGLSVFLVLAALAGSRRLDAPPPLPGLSRLRRRTTLRLEVAETLLRFDQRNQGPRLSPLPAGSGARLAAFDRNHFHSGDPPLSDSRHGQSETRADRRNHIALHRLRLLLRRSDARQADLRHRPHPLLL